MIGLLLVVCAFPASPPDEGHAVRAQVEAVLAGMKHAALAGDTQGYLAAVSTAEPRFVMEMTNWAKDLAKNTPRVFELEIVGDGAVFEPARAEFGMRLKYSVPIASDPDDRSVVKEAMFPTVEFKKDDGEWHYYGEKWSVLKGEGFEVRYTGDFERVAKAVAEAFPIARKHDDEGFEIAGTSHQVIKLYNDMEHLKATVYLSMPDPVLGGWNEAGESIKFMSSYAGSVGAWTRAFAHEYGHVATWEMGPQAGSMAWWVQEGVAELAAEAYDDGQRPGTPRGNDTYIRGLARAGTLAPWDSIASYRTAAQPVKHLAYRQGHHLLGYISDRWGRAGRNRWLRSMASGRSVDEATREILGMPFADLDGAWRSTLPARSEEKGPG